MSRRRATGIALALALIAAACLPAKAHGYGSSALLSYYVESGPLYLGGSTYDGVAACSSSLWYRTVEVLDEDGAVLATVYCGDYGSRDYFESQTSIDVYSPGGRPWWMQRRYFTIEVIE